MSNKNAQIIILCEDSVHFHFAKRYLSLLGFNSRNIFPRHNPKGRSVGSGAKHVIDNYEKEVNAYHSKASYLDYVLVVIVDDDTKNRVRDLHVKYKRLPNESILIFSPVRNIESWFFYIDTGNINVETPDANGEIMDFKSKYKNSKPTEFAKKLKAEICVNGLPDNAPASLRHACKELERLK